MPLRRRLASVLFAAFAVVLLAVPARAQQGDLSPEAGPFDQGKMWTFDEPPIDYFRETYAFDPDSAWFENARLGALRIPGCSASFVSPHGLVMTNHHCARGSVAQVSREGEQLVDEGFYAASLDEERLVDGYYADQLIALEDVTDEIYAALEGAQTDAEREAAREEAIAAVEARLAAAHGGGDDVEVQVVALYNGGRYSAYVFRRYRTLKLVMAPELQLGYFGGDADNFTYPRYALDFAFFRVYGDDGEPLETEHYFPFTDDGVEEGDVVFVIGNPGSTSRLETVAQLEWRRDVQVEALLGFLNARIDALRAVLEEADPAERQDIRNALFGLLNAQKAYGGRRAGLGDPVIMARRADAEETFRAAVEADPALRAEYADVFDQMAAVQAEKQAYAEPFGAFVALDNARYESALMRRALLAYDLLSGGASDAEAARAELQAIAGGAETMQRRLLEARLADIARWYGGSSELGAAVLQGRTPEAAAADLLAASALADSASTAEALAAGTLTLDDPALQLVAAIHPALQDYRSAMAGLGAQERELGAQLGRARYAVYGTDVPPDATFSLRIADGVVQGYAYNGTLAPPYTTFFGLYDHYHSYGPESEWDLPARWLPVPEGLDLSTPMNFLSTADTIGGNSGSPVVNEELEIVGLNFDRTIEGLVRDYIYLPERGRNVMVDARGIVEALGSVYGAERLVTELRSGRLVTQP